MTHYIVKRLLATVPVLLVLVTFSFLLVHLAPGDPAVAIAGHLATPAEVEQLRTAMGLHEPLPVQFVLWIGRLAQGDLGRSVLNNDALTTLIGQRFPVTFSLALLAEFIAIGVGIPLGLLAAWHWNTWQDRAVMIFAVLGFAVPSFWLGYNLIFLFSLRLGWLPPNGYHPVQDGAWPFLKSLLLPAFTDGIVVAALIARMTRSMLLEVLKNDYMRTARAKGLSERTVVLRHAMRNAALPVLTVIGISIANVMTGSVVVETVFSVPGMGRLFVQAVNNRDYPVVQAMVLLSGLVFILTNLAVDISYGFIDPRLRHS